MNNYAFFQHIISSASFALRVFGIIIILAETAYLFFILKTSFFRESIVNLASGFFAVLVQMLLKAYIIFRLQIYIYEGHSFLKLGFHWYGFIAGFFVFGLLQFFTHYLSHKCRLLWCFHEVHHSALHMNSTAGLRTSIFDFFSRDALFLLMPALGIHPLIFLMMYTGARFWGTILHVNEKIINRIPLLEKLITTPSNHHIHHARNPQYLDKNFGEIVPWFDILFKTYAAEQEPPQYGTTKVDTELSFWDSQLHEFRHLWHDIRSASKLKEKINYCLKAPGWVPSTV